MSEMTRSRRGYTYLTREAEDADAEGKYLYATYGDARRDAEDFEGLISNHELRARWLPVRIVHVTVTTTVDVQEVRL